MEALWWWELDNWESTEWRPWWKNYLEDVMAKGYLWWRRRMGGFGEIGRVHQPISFKNDIRPRINNGRAAQMLCM